MGRVDRYPVTHGADACEQQRCVFGPCCGGLTQVRRCKCLRAYADTCSLVSFLAHSSRLVSSSLIIFVIFFRALSHIDVAEDAALVELNTLLSEADAQLKVLNAEKRATLNQHKSSLQSNRIGGEARRIAHECFSVSDHWD
jgi:hypothetical protein